MTPVQKCPRCEKEPTITSETRPAFGTFGDYKTYYVICPSANCTVAVGSTEEDARKAWNRKRGPQLSLEGDELGAGVPDALARQQVLQNVATFAPTAVSFNDIFFHKLSRCFPPPRVQKHLDELVASGEIVVHPGETVRYRLADEPTPPPARKESFMARKRTTETEENQIQLFDVDLPWVREFKKLRNAYNGLIEDKNDAAQKAKEKRQSILELIQKQGIKPDYTGVIRFDIGDERVSITPGESKLHFTSRPKPENEGAGEDGTDSPS